MAEAFQASALSSLAPRAVAVFGFIIAHRAGRRGPWARSGLEGLAGAVAGSLLGGGRSEALRRRRQRAARPPSSEQRSESLRSLATGAATGATQGRREGCFRAAGEGGAF